MKDEIKEILDFIKEQIEKETLSYEPDIELSKEEAKLLLNYITNLQKEKKIPEKLTDILRVDDLIPPVDENMYKIWTQTIKNQNKISEICDYLKSKGDE